jgi:hypothetical protein
MGPKLDADPHKRSCRADTGRELLKIQEYVAMARIADEFATVVELFSVCVLVANDLRIRKSLEIKLVFGFIKNHFQKLNSKNQRHFAIAYIDEKNAGAFGHGKRERRKFATRLKGEVNHDK